MTEKVGVRLAMNTLYQEGKKLSLEIREQRECKKAPKRRRAGRLCPASMKKKNICKKAFALFAYYYTGNL